MRIAGRTNFGKKIRVLMAEEPSEAYAELKEIVDAEKAKGIGSSGNQTLLRGIDNALNTLNSNVQCGRQVPKKQIPLKYIRNNGVKNLWRMDLPLYWRLIYTIMPSGEIEILNLILDIYDHPTYDRVFGYKKK